MVIPGSWLRSRFSHASPSASSRPRRSRRRRRRSAHIEQIERLACETLEQRALLAVNVFDVNGTYTRDGNVGTLLGTLEVDTDTGVVSGFDVTRRGRISGTAISTRTYDTQSIRSQAASGSPLRYDLSATSATETVDLRWNLPTGSLATFGGGAFTFTITSSSLGIFIPVGSGTLALVQPPNSAPTDIELSNDTVPENSPIGTVVGTLATVDPDAGDTFTYTLVPGEGSDDNGSFEIVGNELRAAEAFDFETRSSYTVRVRTTDAGGLTHEESFTIGVTNVNETPTAILLSNTSIPENAPIGTVVGTLTTVDPDAGDTFTYALVPGEGSDDNGSFTVVGNELRAAATFDFETKNSYTIRVRTTDEGGRSFERQFEIEVLDVNEAPADILLSNASIPENSPVGTVVGTLTTVDPDAGDTFLYTLVAGEGPNDNGSFQIVNNELQSAVVFNYEAQEKSYTVRVRTTDAGGLTHEEAFTISVTDVNETPTAIELSNTSIPENSPIGTVVGTLTTVDPDAGDTFLYTLVAGEGPNDNGSFQIVNNELQSAVVFNYEAQASYTVLVRSTDAGGLLNVETSFTIQVTDVSEIDPPDAEAWFLPDFPDQQLREAAWDLYGDRKLDRSEVIDLLRQAGRDDSVVSAAELEALRRIVNRRVDDRFELNMPAHVRNLAGKVVAENSPGNDRFRSQLLGDLQAGSGNWQLEELITKWFYGGDHPVAETIHGAYDYGRADGPLFIGAPSFDDVIQGRVNSCYLLAVAGGIAETYPASIEEMFIDNGDDTWTVRFFVWRKVGEDVVRFEDYVTVDRQLPYDVRYEGSIAGEPELVFAGEGRPLGDDTQPLWVPLLEKAYAQWAEIPDTVAPWRQRGVPANSYAAIELGQPHATAAHLLGTAARRLDPSVGNFDAVRSVLDAGVADGQMVAMATVSRSDFEGREPVEGRLVEGHVYFVEGLAPQDVYSIINPYPEHKFDARAIDLNWESVREGNFREIIIADANVSLGNEDALYRDPVFGGGSVVVSPASQWITDLNGDGIADTLWRDAATGAVTGHIQDVDGAVVATRSLGGDTDRVIAATGDFDGDRITDIVWHQESTGRTIVQTARSRGVIEYSSTADAASWSVIAAGDYDGDSRADLIWKNSQTGEHTLWLMDGLVATRRYHLGSDPDWSIVATAPDYDANGDGMTDLIWRNETTGETQLNRMAGGRTISTQDIGGDLDWAVVAAADFDADGRGDVLWRQSTTGALAREFPEAGSTAPPLNWAAVELADLDADGSPETVWWRTPLGVRAAAFASHAGSGVSSRIPDVTNWSLVRSPWLDDDGESA